MLRTRFIVFKTPVEQNDCVVQPKQIVVELFEENINSRASVAQHLRCCSLIVNSRVPSDELIVQEHVVHVEHTRMRAEKRQDKLYRVDLRHEKDRDQALSH